jgi:hypothetical protein
MAGDEGFHISRLELMAVDSLIIEPVISIKLNIDRNIRLKNDLWLAQKFSHTRRLTRFYPLLKSDWSGKQLKLSMKTGQATG